MPEEITVPEAQPEQSEAAQQEVSEAPFLAIPGEDGNDTVFTSPDDVVKAFKEGTMRHSQYKQKLTEVEEKAKTIAQKEADLERQISAALERQSEFEKINKMFQQRPDVYNYIQNQLRNPNGGQREYVDKTAAEVKEQLKALEEKYENDRREREFQQQREKVFKSLKAKYPDFDTSQINQLMDEIESYQSLPSDQGFSNFAELLYYANKGRGTPAPRVTKKNAPMGSTPPTQLRGGIPNGDFDDITAQAKKDAGLM